MLPVSLGKFQKAARELIFETFELDLDRMPRILDPLSGSFAPWLPELPPRPFDSVQVEKNRLSRAGRVQ